MNKAKRRHFSDQEKVAILKRHLLDKTPISDLCDEFKLYPNQFYDWLKKFFENGRAAFANNRSRQAGSNLKDRKIELFEAKLSRVSEVLVELQQQAICSGDQCCARPCRTY